MDNARPLTREELLRWLDNISKMYQSSLSCNYGSTAHKLYIEGMPKAAAFIAECVKLTEEIK